MGDGGEELGMDGRWRGGARTREGMGDGGEELRKG